MRYLVTGGAGYVGSHLTRKLLAQGHEVRVLDAFLYGDHGLAGLSHPNLRVLRGDIRDLDAMKAATKGVDSVIALAAIVGDGACAVNQDYTRQVNLDATRVLAKACDANGVSRVVFASSCSVYGASDDEMLTEDSKLNPVSLYAETRISSEEHLLNGAFPRAAAKPVVLRLATVFGLSHRMRFDLYVNLFVAKAAMEGRFQVFGGDQWRPNLHAQDAADAFILASQAPASAVAGQVFNVGGEENNLRIKDVANLVSEAIPGVNLEYRADVVDRRNYRVRFEKIRKLGFAPKFTVRDGIQEMAAAIRDGQFQDFGGKKYSNVQSILALQGAGAPVLNSWDVQSAARQKN